MMPSLASRIAGVPAARLGLLLLLVSLACAGGVAAQLAPGSVGKHLYLDGMRPNGEPLTAVVGGDVEMLGTQFSCHNCHGRSGMGAAEGNYIVPAIVGDILFTELLQPGRPAYDDASLARLLRDGIDPAGREVDSLMPRFRLTDDEVAALGTYLRRLSSGASPGVSDTTMRIATVVTDETPADLRESVLSVIQTFVDERNRQTRLESQRPDRGNSPASRLPTAYREWQLEVWMLSGPQSTYRKQLRDYYESDPVFAVVGGMVGGAWEPIGNFCEHMRIPCLFPSTTRPASAAGDFYAMHFSGGLELEARLIAYHLRANPPSAVVQLHCGPDAGAAARLLATLLLADGLPNRELEVDCDAQSPIRLPDNVDPDAAVVLWMRPAELQRVSINSVDHRVYISSTLVDQDFSNALPESVAMAFAAHPFLLPGSRDAAYVRFLAWARSRGIDIVHPRLQSEAFFACMAANDALSHLGRFFIREYALDMLDHAQGLAAYIPNYPRPGFGPGQRFLSKGGYILPVVAGDTDSEAAVWILP